MAANVVGKIVEYVDHVLEFELKPGINESSVCFNDEAFVVQRIYADRLGPGSERPNDWGDVHIKIQSNNGKIFEGHLLDIARPLGDLGEKVAKLLDEPDMLLQRMGADPHKFHSHLVGILMKAHLLQKGTQCTVKIEGELLVPIRIAFRGVLKRPVQ